MSEAEIPEIPRYHNKRTGRELREKEEQIHKAYQVNCRKNFLLFVRGLRIDSVRGPRLFENCMALFQRETFEDLAPNIEAVRDGEMPEYRRWWIERTKKAGKDSDLAVIIIWLIAFPVRPFYAQVGAADKEQAGIVKDRISNLLQINPWLNDYIEIYRYEVRSKAKKQDGSPLAKLHIMSSDISGAHGGTPDLLIINELSHITKWEFVENLMDNADGVAQGMVIIATNAGFKGTKAEVLKNNAMSSAEWMLHIWKKPAPWHDRKIIEDARRRNPPSRFKRLWKGRWASGKGDALDEDDIEACFTLKGPMADPEEGYVYIAGLDLGVSHDHAGLVILGISRKDQMIRLAYMRGWEPTNTGEVDLIDVENTCRALARHYHLTCIWYDPHQAKLMAQRLQRSSIRMLERVFSPSNLTLMAVTLLQVVESRRLQMYDDDDGRLRRDFGKFNIVEKTYGSKLEAVSDEFGHADVGTALVIALPHAIAMINDPDFLMQDDQIANVDDEELTPEEVEQMPEALREIYDLDEEERERTLIERSRQEHLPDTDPFSDFA